MTFNFKENEKWVSSSSDEPVDTSDELLDVGNQTDKSLTEIRHGNSGERGRVNDAPTACHPDEGERIIREAEASHARLHTSPGKVQTDRCITNWQNMNEIQTSAVDEKYLVIGSHVDAALQAKIINHEYIDFARLLPKDRITKEDDHQLELVNKGGMTYFAPISDRDMVGINSFSKWEQVFRIFSNIYTRAYPERATELIQYNHIIYTASLTFLWENVYTYDREFCIHLNNFPQHTWSVILQQAWSMYLKDKLSHDNKFNSFSGHNNRHKKEACKRFNKGKCHEGLSCKYDHRCTVPSCGKFGHGMHICRKRNNAQPDANHGPVPSSTADKVVKN